MLLFIDNIYDDILFFIGGVIITYIIVRLCSKDVPKEIEEPPISDDEKYKDYYITIPQIISVLELFLFNNKYRFTDFEEDCINYNIYKLKKLKEKEDKEEFDSDTKEKITGDKNG